MSSADLLGLAGLSILAVAWLAGALIRAHRHAEIIAWLRYIATLLEPDEVEPPAAGGSQQT